MTLSGPSASAVDVPWSTVTGSAVGGCRLHGRAARSTSTPASRPRPSPCASSGDTTIEWNTTLQLDEVFFVDLGTPTNATLLKSRATVTIVDDDRTLPGLQFVSAVADGGATAGRVRLQWRVPAAPTNPGPGRRPRPLERRRELHRSRQRGRGRDGGRVPPRANPGIPVNAPGETQVVEHLDRPLVFGTATPSSRSTPRPPPRRSGPPSWPRPSTRPARSRSRGRTPPSGSAPERRPAHRRPRRGLHDQSNDGRGPRDGARRRGRAVAHGLEPRRPRQAGAQPLAARSPSPTARDSSSAPSPARCTRWTGRTARSSGPGARSSAWRRLPSSGGVQGTPAGLFKAYERTERRDPGRLEPGASNNTFYMLDPVDGVRPVDLLPRSMGSVRGHGGRRLRRQPGLLPHDVVERDALGVRPGHGGVAEPLTRRAGRRQPRRRSRPRTARRSSATGGSTSGRRTARCTCTGWPTGHRAPRPHGTGRSRASCSRTGGTATSTSRRTAGCGE